MKNIIITSALICLQNFVLRSQDSLLYFSSTTGAACQQVEYMNGFLYTGTGTTMRIYNASDTASPPYDSIFEYRFRSYIHELKFHNNFLYVAANHDGISKWDVSDPYHPQMMAEYVPDSLREAAYDISFKGDSLIVAYGTKVALFRDLGNSFQKLSDFGYLGGNGNGLMVGGDLKDSIYACAAMLSNFSSNDGIYLYNIKTLNLISHYQQTYCDPEDIVFSQNSNLLHVAGGTQSYNNPFNPFGIFYSLDISNLSSPQLAYADTIKGFIGLAIADVINLENINDTIYVATTAGMKDGQGLPDTTWVFVYDATNPNNIHLIQHIPAGLWHFDVSTEMNGRAFIASEWYGVKTVDITDFNNPTDLGNTQTGGWNVGADSYGNILLVANEGYGFKKYDITDPYNPLLTGVCQTGTFCHHVIFSSDGNYIFAFYSTSTGMYVFETATLNVVDSITSSGLANGKTALWGGQLFTSFKPIAGPEVLHIFDVTDPLNVALTASHEMDIEDMEVDNGRLYISGKDSLTVYDVSNNGFQFLAAYVLPDSGREMAVFNDTVFLYLKGNNYNEIGRYVYDGVNNSIIFDTYLSLSFNKPEPQAIAADSLGVYLAFNLYGLYAYDKVSLQEKGYFRTGLDLKELTNMHGVRKLFCKDGYIFLSEYFGQTNILSFDNSIMTEIDEFAISDQAQCDLAISFPNPFTDFSIIEVPVDDCRKTEAFLYDSRGCFLREIKINPNGKGRIQRNGLPAGSYRLCFYCNSVPLQAVQLIVK